MLRYLERRARKIGKRKFPDAEPNRPKPQDLASPSKRISFVLTTHSKRFHQAKQLISDIRAALPAHISIYVVVNSFPEAQNDNYLQSNFVREISSHELVFPICLGRQASLAEMWNIGIRFSATDQVVVLGDDIFYSPDTLSEVLQGWIENISDRPLTILNDSWGHFSISQRCVERVGFFDERLLGFGEEDSDYLQRYLESFREAPVELAIPGFHNESSLVGFEGSVKGKGKYSLFNSVYINEKYKSDEKAEFNSKFLGKVKRALVTVNPYPLDEYRRRMRHLLKETNANSIRQKLAEEIGSDLI